MGKNRDRESLIRLLVNTIVHEIVMRHTHKPESKHFLFSEIIEYLGQTDKISDTHNWNENDKEYIKEKVMKKIEDKLKNKYTDIPFSLQEIEKLVNKEIIEV